jgi:hypothetical protein
LGGLSDLTALATAMALASEPYTTVGINFSESMELIKFSKINFTISLKKNKKTKDNTKLKIKPGTKNIFSPN